jgi:hypothetical protein
MDNHKGFDGNEKFNPLVLLSRVDGYRVGSKPVYYVAVDGGKTISATIEIFSSQMIVIEQ